MAAEHRWPLIAVIGVSGRHMHRSSYEAKGFKPWFLRQKGWLNQHRGFEFMLVDRAMIDGYI